MPRYDYRCPECGKVEERTVTIAEMDDQVCVHTRHRGRLKNVSFHKMERLPHYHQVDLYVPIAMRAENTLKASEVGPSTEKAKENWKKEGIRRVGQRW